MVYQVKTVNGQKTKIPLSGSVATGNPIGSLLYTYKKIQPKNYLYCDGSFFDQNQYPALYLYLGSNQLPDYRECTMVGAEENTTDNIATHDVYAQGEFKDDQLQEHRHKSSSRQSYASGSGNYAMYGTTTGSEQNGVYDVYNARVGTTTHGKQKAVYVYIKAVDGVDITDEDTFLNTVKNFVEEKNSYSTTEMLTGGTWIDGKPIYRKVVDCGALPNNTAKTVAHNIANIEWVVKYNGMAHNGNEWLQLPASYYSDAAIGLSVNATSINLRPYSNRTSYTTTLVTIEYTKTTD